MEKIMYKALRVLKVGGQIFYIGDVLPENASEIINVDAFIKKGWIELMAVDAVAKKPVENVSIVDAMSKNLSSKKGKKKAKTKKKIGSILASKSKEKPVETTLEAATLPKPDMD
tara:strand:- start:17599 stop:17940 length:342 start_codon:yes stop_codon:yes gene_type:complete